MDKYIDFKTISKNKKGLKLTLDYLIMHLIHKYG